MLKSLIKNPHLNQSSEHNDKKALFAKKKLSKTRDEITHNKSMGQEAEFNLEKKTDKI